MGLIRDKKKLTHVLFKNDFYFEQFPNHYYRGYLWANVEAMRKAITGDDPDEFMEAGAACTHAHYIQIIPENGHCINKAPRRMGEFHFVQGNWNEEIVAHEVYHAVTNICKVCNVHPANHIEFEEFGAYLQGNLTCAVYRWLWKVDARKNVKDRLWKFLDNLQLVWEKVTHKIVQDAPKTL